MKKMRRIVCVLLISILVIALLYKCNDKRLHRMDSTVSEELVSQNIAIENLNVIMQEQELLGFEVDLVNESEMEYQYSYEYHLEMWKQDKWQELKQREDKNIKAILLVISPEGKKSERFDNLYSTKLHAGHYRLVLEVTPTDGGTGSLGTGGRDSET